MTDYSLIPTGGAGGVRDAAVEVVAAALGIDYDEVLGGLMCYQGDRCATADEQQEVNLVIEQVERLRGAVAALVLAREPGPDPLCDVPHLDLGLRCTLPPGHDGRHQARDIGVRGRLVHWTAPEFDRKSS